VEALPRALRYIHDRVGVAGISPYKLPIGRDRPVAGLPYTPERECLDAHDYFNHLEELDTMVADQMDGDHLMAQRRNNAGIKKRPAFYVGDQVAQTSGRTQDTNILDRTHYHHLPNRSLQL